MPKKNVRWCGTCKQKLPPKEPLYMERHSYQCRDKDGGYWVHREEAVKKRGMTQRVKINEVLGNGVEWEDMDYGDSCGDHTGPVIVRKKHAHILKKFLVAREELEKVRLTMAELRNEVD